MLRVNILRALSRSLTEAVFYIRGFVALSHLRARMKSVSWKNAPRVIVVVVILLAAALRQDWIPDRALYTRLSALIRRESAHPRDHCYPDILRGKKNEKSGESAVYIRRGMSDERIRKGGRAGGCVGWIPQRWYRYPRAIRP